MTPTTDAITMTGLWLGPVVVFLIGLVSEQVAALRLQRPPS